MAVPTPAPNAHALVMNLPVDLFADWLRASGASAETLRLRRHYLRNLAAAFPDRGLLALTQDDLTRFIARSGWAPETRKSARASIRSFYRWGVESGRLDCDPSARLPAVRIPQALPRPAPEDVYVAALAVAIPRDRRMLLLAGSAGLRRAEIARVHTDHLSADGSLRINGKGGRIRTIPLHPILASDLLSLPRGWVFPGRSGGPMAAASVGAVLKRLLGPNWSGHTLRHRFASRAYLAERDLRAVQTLLGHSKPETTARYTAVPDGALRNAVMAAAL